MLGADAARDQSKPAPMADAALGRVHSVSGSQITVAVGSRRAGGLNGADITVGRCVKVQSGTALIVGVVAEVWVEGATPVRDQEFQGKAYVDLMGEIASAADGRAVFHRGVNTYPSIGDAVAPLSIAEMRIIFDG